MVAMPALDGSSNAFTRVWYQVGRSSSKHNPENRILKHGNYILCAFIPLLRHPSDLIRPQTLQENAQTLQLQPENFQAVLCSMGFHHVKKLGEPGEGRKHPF